MHTLTPCACQDPGHDRYRALREEAKVLKKVQRRARKTDPATSHAAARSMSHTNYNEKLILQALIRLPNNEGTCYEIASQIGDAMDHVKVDRSMRLLVRHGFVVETGRTRSGESGRQCIIWKLVEKNH